MHGLGPVLNAVIPVFCIAILGMVMRQCKWLTEDADRSLFKVTVNVLMPALIVDSVLHNDVLKQINTVVLAPIVGFLGIAVGMIVAVVFGRTAFKDRKVIATFVLCAGIYNYGYVPVPLVKVLFPPDTLGVLFAHNLGVEIAFWTLGLMALGAVGSGNVWRNMVNAPVLAIFISLAINFTGADKFIPDFILLTARLLGQCAVPMGLILVGATMADYLHEFRTGWGWRVMLLSCVVRLGVVPILFLLVARYLPCSVELKRVIIVQAAMPAGTFSILLARHYGGDPSTALRIVIGTSVASLVTMPFWIRFGLKFAGV
jgi:malate permease and related proteins